MKNFISSITFKYGKISSIPEPFIDDKGVRIELKKMSNNKVELLCSFDDTNLSKEEAAEYSQKISETIALTTSLKNAVSSKFSSNVQFHWQVTGSSTTQGKVSHTVNSAIARSVSFEIKECLSFNLASPVWFLKHQQSIECFNRALVHKESVLKDQSAVSIWLRLSWEALQLELGGVREQELRKEIVSNMVLTKTALADLKYSIGEYYVHKKRNSGQTKTPIPINECIKHMQKIHLHYLKIK